MLMASELMATEFVMVAVACSLLIRYYRSPLVTEDVTASVYIGWVLGFAGVLFLPYDLSIALVENRTSGPFEIVWRVIYWM
jgi:hypothetical protein